MSYWKSGKCTNYRLIVFVIFNRNVFHLTDLVLIQLYVCSGGNNTQFSHHPNWFYIRIFLNNTGGIVLSFSVVQFHVQGKFQRPLTWRRYLTLESISLRNFRLTMILLLKSSFPTSNQLIATTFSAWHNTHNVTSNRTTKSIFHGVSILAENHRWNRTYPDNPLRPLEQKHRKAK